MAKANPKKTNTTAKISFWQDDKKVGWLLAALAFALYAQTIGHGFVLDDIAVVHGNKFVKAGFGGIGDILNSFYWHGFSGYENANSGIFRPVSLILFAIEWAFAPESPKFFHFVQVLLYSITIYQLYRLLRQLFRDYSISLALIACGIWMLMPVHTEVVANVKSADEVLSVLFFLVSFRQLLNWSENGKIQSLVFSALFIFLSLLSKEGAVLFIPAMLLGLMMFRGKKIKDLILPGIILFAVSLIWFGWHTAIISSGPDRVPYDYRNNALLSNESKIDQIGTAIGLQARYWMKMLLGYPLSYNYSFNEIPVDGFAGIWTWISLAGIGAALFFAWKFFKSIPVISFGILFYFICFALTSNIFYMIGDIFAERFTFAPSIGFAIVLSWLILKFTKGFEEKRLHAQSMYVLIGIGLIYSILTFSRSADWKDQETLFTVDVDHAPNSARVRDNYGGLLFNSALAATDPAQKKRLLGESYTQYKAAADLDPLDFQAAQALGQVCYHQGDYKASAEWSRKSTAAFRKMGAPTDNPQTLVNLGDALMLAQEYDSAFAAFDHALALNPKDDGLIVKIAGAYLAHKDTANAIASLKKATTLNPNSGLAWDKMANLYGMLGQYENSNMAFNELLKIDPKNMHAWQMGSTNYLMLGDTAKAMEYAGKYKSLGGK